MKEAKLVKDIEKFVLDTSELKTLEGKGVAFMDEGVYEGQRVIRIYFP